MADEHDLPLDEYHRALHAITNGDPEVYKALFSHRDDVTLANPFGPPARGWGAVAATLEGRRRITAMAKSWGSRTCPR